MEMDLLSFPRNEVVNVGSAGTKKDWILAQITTLSLTKANSDLSPNQNMSHACVRLKSAILPNSSN